jgi:hypothetical protein
MGRWQCSCWCLWGCLQLVELYDNFNHYKLDNYHIFLDKFKYLCRRRVLASVVFLGCTILVLGCAHCC